MNSRQRVLAALDHQEADRVAYDLGSTQVTGIAVQAYKRLRAHLGLPPRLSRSANTSAAMSRRLPLGAGGSSTPCITSSLTSHRRTSWRCGKRSSPSADIELPAVDETNVCFPRNGFVSQTWKQILVGLVWKSG